jgi:hypothetical protein
MNGKPARIAAALALTLATGTLGAIAATPSALAVPPTCSFQTWDVVTATTVSGYSYFVCTSPPEHEPLAVTVYRNATVVATGSGSATYTCNGTTWHLYNINGEQDFGANCG